MNFKRSAFDPIALHGESELYEMAFHSNGRLYRDWSRRHPIATPRPRLDGTEQWHQRQGTQGDYRVCLTCGRQFTESLGPDPWDWLVERLAPDLLPVLWDGGHGRKDLRSRWPAPPRTSATSTT
jgi:hypothetical protein